MGHIFQAIGIIIMMSTVMMGAVAGAVVGMFIIPMKILGGMSDNTKTEGEIRTNHIDKI